MNEILGLTDLTELQCDLLGFLAETTPFSLIDIYQVFKSKSSMDHLMNCIELASKTGLSLEAAHFDIVDAASANIKN